MKKRNPWWFVLDVALVLAMMMGPVLYFRWDVSQLRFALIWMIVIVPLLVLSSRAVHKFSRSMHEMMAWKYRNLPPKQNFYWRPPKPPNSD